MLLLSLAALMALLPHQASAETTCFGATFQTVSSNFQYKARITNTSCDLSKTNVTRLFMLGACSKQHSNNFGGVPPPCPPGDWNVLNTSSATCTNVFASTRSSDVRTPNGTAVFDSGQICNDGYQGVIFVETDCSSLNASNIQLMQRNGSGDFCWNGHVLTAGALAGIIIGGVAGVCLLVGLPLLLCLLHWRRKRRRMSHAQGFGAVEPSSKPGAPPKVVRVADSVFVTRPPDAKEVDLGEQVFLEHPYDIEFEASEEEVPLSEEAVPLSRVVQV